MDKEKIKNGFLIVVLAIHNFHNISTAKEPLSKPLEEHYRNIIANGLVAAGYECSSIQEEKRIKEEKENENTI